MFLIFNRFYKDFDRFNFVEYCVFLCEANSIKTISGGLHRGGEASSNRCHHNGWRHGDHGLSLSMKTLMNRLSMSLLLSYHLSMSCFLKNYRCSF